MDTSYTVLARKYRSQDFASLIGQDVLVKTLTTAINTGRIVNAEQEKIDSSRGSNEKIPDVPPETSESSDDEEIPLPDFIENLK